MNVAEYIESLEPTVRRPGSGETGSFAAVAAREPTSFDIPFEPVERQGVMGLIELILKDRPRLHRVIRDPSLQSDLVPRLLAIAMAGFVLYGVAMSLVLGSAGVWPRLTAIEARLQDGTISLIAFEGVEAALPAVRPWLDGGAARLIAAYTLGLIAATGVCLPALYFYSLLSGVKMTMLDCVVHALKSKATAAVALVGILPVYAAISMGMLIFGGPQLFRNGTLLLGLILPFIAGLWGTRSLYVGFGTLADTLPCERQAERACFLRRLVLSWSALYTAVTPVMIFTLWEAMG